MMNLLRRWAVYKAGYAERESTVRWLRDANPALPVCSQGGVYYGVDKITSNLRQGHRRLRAQDAGSGVQPQPF